MRTTIVAGGIVGSAALLVCWVVWWTRPPQMGADDEVFQTVDALFTAVTARDENLLGKCAQRLADCKSAGKLPGAAADYLDGVIQKARDGRWESAAERLYDFMKAQRREGAADNPKKKKARSG
jgi:hypothetical protein